MMRRFAVMAAVLAVVLLEACLLSVLPGPFSRLRLTVMLAVALIAGFRFGDGILAALLGGALLDILSPEPVGAHFLAMAGMVALQFVLFTRILTNVSWPSFVGINAAAFLVYQALFVAVRTAQDVIEGHYVFFWPSPGALADFFAALLLQIALAALFSAIAKRLQNALRSSFLIVH